LIGAGFVIGETRIALAPQAMSSDGKISMQQAMKKAPEWPKEVDNNWHEKCSCYSCDQWR
jgi:hypothetical protein